MSQRADLATIPVQPADIPTLDQIPAAAADVSLNGHRLTSVADATAATDALNRESGDARYVQQSGAGLPSSVATASAQQAPLTALGLGLVNVPAWQPGTAYPAGFVVQLANGSLVKAATTHTSGSTRNPGNWTEQVAGGLWATPEAQGADPTGASDSTQALQSIAASGAHIACAPHAVYLHRWTITLATAGQQVVGNGATFMRAPQAVSACDASQGTITAGSTASVKVQAISGGTGASAWSFQVGDQVVVEQGGFFDPSARTIASITGAGPYTITLSTAIGAGAPFTNNLTTSTTLTGGTGATLRHGWNQVNFNATANGITLRGLTLDGNLANWSWGRWQHTAAIEGFGNPYDNASFANTGERAYVDHCTIQNQYGDGFDPGAPNLDVAHCTFQNVKGRGLVLSGNFYNPTNVVCRVIGNTFLNCNGDSAVAGADGTGSLDFSAGGPCAEIHANTFIGGIDGIGGIGDVNNSNLTITANDFWGLSGLAVNATSGLGSDNVLIANNRIYGYSHIKVTTTSPATCKGWTIHDNLFVGGAQLIVWNGDKLNVHDNTFRSYQLAAPYHAHATASATGGTFAPGTYYWVCTAYNAVGETIGSTEVSATVAANGSAVLSNTIVPGAAGYKWYRSTASGAETTGSTLVATNAGPFNTNWTDTGAAASASACPTANTTWDQTITLIKLGVTGGGVTNAKVHDNIVDGGGTGINVSLGCSTVSVSKNLLVNQYTSPLQDTSGLTGIAFHKNTVVGNATTVGAGFYGITANSADVTHNDVDVSASTGAGRGISISAGTGQRCVHNKVRVGSTGATPIFVTATATNALLDYNDLDAKYTDSGVSTRGKTANTTSTTGSLSGTATLSGTAGVSVANAEVQVGDAINAWYANAAALTNSGQLVARCTVAGTLHIYSTNASDVGNVAYRIVH